MQKIHFMDKIRVSIVSYLNSKPFLYGIQQSPIQNNLDLSLDIPAKIVAKLSFGLADLGLIPVAGLDELDDYKIIGNYCIGAKGRVKTVVLVSEVPLHEVDTILMDYQSRTSVLLAKVLAKFHWKKSFKWENTCNDFQHKSIKGNTAGVLIGDRVFEIEGKYKYSYDLSEEWEKFTGLPFVFAVWAGDEELSNDFENAFNAAMKLGVENVQQVVDQEQENYPGVDISDYFANNISFDFDEDKRKGMQKFLELAKKLEPVEYH